MPTVSSVLEQSQAAAHEQMLPGQSVACVPANGMAVAHSASSDTSCTGLKMIDSPADKIAQRTARQASPLLNSSPHACTPLKADKRVRAGGTRYGRACCVCAARWHWWMNNIRNRRTWRVGRHVHNSNVCRLTASRAYTVVIRSVLSKLFLPRFACTVACITNTRHAPSKLDRINQIQDGEYKRTV
jgi:hypothetical protein